MHLQLRNRAQHIDARLALLRAQPHLRPNWIALAVAHDYADNKEEAVRVLAAYEDVQRDVPERSLEHSEVLLYHASLLAQLGEMDELLALLDAPAGRRILDKPGADELRARALQGAGRAAEAEQVWRSLLRRNANNKEHVIALVETLGARADGSDATAAAVLEKLQEEYPKSMAVQRLMLTVAQDATFERHARAYIRRALVKNLPSLFSDIKALYTNTAKRDTIGGIAESLRDAWDPRGGARDEPPSSYLWTLYFLAQHYSYSGDAERALQYINSAIAHTPTLPELHMTRARILKRAGSLDAAADAMEDARLLDGQDRYLNTKAAKYMQRVDRIEQASSTLKLFTKPDVPDPVNDLLDMQALTFLLENARAHQRRGEDALALKRLHQIAKTVQDVYDDQFDFHSYCMRKMMLRAYMKTLRFEDALFADNTYALAAASAVDMYVRLYDQQQSPPPSESPNANEKKAQQKTRKAEAHSNKADQAQPAAANATVDGDPPPPVDTDPHGEALLATNTPLQDAHRFVQALQTYVPHRLETWFSTFELALRERRWLLALRALAKAHAIRKDDPGVHLKLLRLRKALADENELPDTVRAEIDRVAVVIPALNAPLDSVNTAFLQASDAPANLVAGVRGILVLHGASGAKDASALLESLVRTTKPIPLPVLEEALSLLAEIGDDSAATTLRERAHARFPLADAFKTRDMLDSEQRMRADARSQWVPAAAP